MPHTGGKEKMTESHRLALMAEGKVAHALCVESQSECRQLMREAAALRTQSALAAEAERRTALSAYEK